MHSDIRRQFDIFIQPISPGLWILTLRASVEKNNTYILILHNLIITKTIQMNWNSFKSQHVFYIDVFGSFEGTRGMSQKSYIISVAWTMPWGKLMSPIYHEEQKINCYSSQSVAGLKIRKMCKNTKYKLLL